MAKYFKSSSNTDGLLSPEFTSKMYRDRYKVVGNTEDANNEIPYGVVTAKITKEQSYPNFDFKGNDSTTSSHVKTAKDVGVSPRYLEDHMDNNGFYTNDIYAAIGEHRLLPGGGRARESNPDSRDAGIHYAKHISVLKKAEDFQPTELFTTIPKSVEITEASVDPSLKSSFLTIGAMLHKEHGVPITASESLSKWSSSLGEHAQRKGLPVVGHEDNPDMLQNNDISEGYHEPFRVSRSHIKEMSENHNLIPEHEVKDARLHLRRLLGREPKQHMSSQFENVQFPGMENF